MHVIIMVTVGLSVIDKTWAGRPLYDLLMGSDDGMSRGLLADCQIQAVESGTGWRARYDVSAQADVEKECFTLTEGLPPIPSEIKRRKKNRYSAEVSSLYAALKVKGLEPKQCRIVLLATDSSEGIFAARLNKRIIAHHLLGCDKDTAFEWNEEADNPSIPIMAQIPIVRVSGLQVLDAARFTRDGTHSLENVICDQQAHLQPGDQRIVNITGGFKGAIPITVEIAWRQGWEVIYLYEETEGYLIIPPPQISGETAGGVPGGMQYRPIGS
jgi:hypothetical protein